MNGHALAELNQELPSQAGLGGVAPILPCVVSPATWQARRLPSIHGYACVDTGTRATLADALHSGLPNRSWGICSELGGTHREKKTAPDRWTARMYEWAGENAWMVR